MVKPSELLRGRKYCSMRCSTEDRPHRPFISHGYRYVWNGYGFVLEHRVVMEAYIGRKLTTDEHVHHINRIKIDNRIENLMLVTNRKEHQLLHGREDYHVFHKTIPCTTCGEPLLRTLCDLKRGHGHAFCSKECFLKSDAFAEGILKRKEKHTKKVSTMTSAKCKTCGEEKPVSEFRRHKDGSVFTYTCKDCIKLKQHDHYTKWYSDPINQEYSKAKANVRYQELKRRESADAI